MLDIRSVLAVMTITLAMFMALDAFVDRLKASLESFEVHMQMLQRIRERIINSVKELPTPVTTEYASPGEAAAATLKNTSLVGQLVRHSANLIVLDGIADWRYWKYQILVMRTLRIIGQLFLMLVFVLSILWITASNLTFVVVSNSTIDSISDSLQVLLVISIVVFLAAFCSFVKCRRSAMKKDQLCDPVFYQKLTAQ
ncbi:MAG TPA: hypothetical protein VGL38_08045 [bacterium]|jgi:hypothetical protein